MISGIAFFATIIATFCVVFLFTNIIATWSVYGFTPVDWVVGWKIRDSGTGTYVVLLPRFCLGTPISIFWFCADYEQELQVAHQLAMRRIRRFEKFSREYHDAAFAALESRMKVWPSKELAIYCGDPDGWWPGKILLATTEQ